MEDMEKLAQMMFRCALATGHGDTFDNLIWELEWQIKEKIDEIVRLRWENANMEKLWGKSEGTWMEIRDNQDAEIERLRDSLERIACFCQEQCKMNCAGWIASSALKEKE